MFRRVELRAAASAVLLIALCPAALKASGEFPACAAPEEAKLIASDPETADYLGWAVAILDDTVVVGAPSDSHTGLTNAGSVYVFVRSGTSWIEQARLTASDSASGDEFGSAVALSGDTLIVGADGDDHSGLISPGSAYVFVRSGTTWSEQAKLTASAPAGSAFLGRYVALAGDTALVAARGEESAYVFVRSGTTWTEQAKLTANDEVAEGFGSSVALAGDTALVGAREDNHSGNSLAGSAYVFVRSGTTWSKQQRLTASDSEPWDLFGGAVALQENTALIGATGGDNLGLGKYAGAAYVFVRSGTNWSEEAKLSGSDTTNGDEFGTNVALHANRALVGAQLDNTEPGDRGGSAYVFERSGTTWSQHQKFIASDGDNGDYLGYSVALWNDTVFVGAWGNDHSGSDDAGSAYVFRISPAHEVTSYCTAGTSASGCQASLSSCGIPSTSAPLGFNLQASNVEGVKDGLFFFGTNGRQANSWGNGTSYQCVVPPVLRAGTLSGSGTLGACDGSFFQDLNALWCPSCPKPGHNPGAGATVQAQLWYRDPLSTSNQTTSLSDAIEFVVAP